MAAMQDMFSKSRFARCRTRFVAPVILVEGKVGKYSGDSVSIRFSELNSLHKLHHEILAPTSDGH